MNYINHNYISYNKKLSKKFLYKILVKQVNGKKKKGYGNRIKLKKT